jgi:hypothetical protein
MAKFDPKAKAKKQKIIAGVLGLVLVGVLAFQAPTILGAFGGGSSTASEPAATTPPPAPAPAPATPGAPAAAPAAPAPTPPGGSAELVDSDPVPAPAEGQLVTFDRFESKDPFVQQVSDTPAAGQAPAEPKAPAGDANDGQNAEGGEGSQPEEQPVAATPAPRNATISVNGAEHVVAVGGSFPEGDPMFKLVSLKGRTARVGIVGGGYANGSATISLRRGGKPVTLMNTADGTTYVLRLVG